MYVRSVLIMLTFTVSTFLFIAPVHSNIAPNPQGLGTLWVPAGPMVDKLLFQVYSDRTAEFNAFQTGGLDVADALVPPSLLGVGGQTNFKTDSRFLVTNPVSQYDIFGID